LEISVTSESVTGSFVLDFGELANYIYQSALKYEEKGSRHLQQDASDLVYDMIDDFITEQLYWARPLVRRPSADAKDWTRHERVGGRRRNRRDEYYPQQPFEGTNLRVKYKHLLRNIPRPGELLDEIADRMAEMVYDHMDLPTWRIVHLTRGRNGVLVEIGEDYRVEQWMKEHGHEFGVRFG
jgi:hypothetical protein